MKNYLEKIKYNMTAYIKELGNSEILQLFQSIESGKMVRSQIIQLIAEKDDKNVMAISSIVELIHLASLLHDDVIDNSDTRRGKPSINATEGSKISIMLGDILYSKAFFELGKFDYELISRISSAVIKLSIGEIADVKLSDHFNNDEVLYLDMIYNKTASLIETSTAVGAILGNKDVETFAKYGFHLGMAFQIVDDILDIVSTSEELGKPAMSDFLEGKTTIPYIRLWHWLNDDGKRYLESLHKKELSENEKSWILVSLENSGALRQAKDLARFHSKSAISLIKDYPKLVEIAEKLLLRGF
jgi:octaprenyl-diphosphate synthase